MENERTLELEVTPVYQKNLDAFNDPNIKIIVNQGGTRSSKTYSLCQFLIVHSMGVQNQVITIARKTSPSLKSSVMRDFFEILNNGELYHKSFHNKTDREYILYNNLFEFMSLDTPQKKRGTKRDILWLNEANEFEWEDFFQLMIRTSGKIFLDYNPSDEFHWIYDKVLPRDDCAFIQSTYLDNPFLEDSLVKEIERLRAEDPEYWKVYGLGEIGKHKSIIYDNWDIINSYPNYVDEQVYGLDFGYNNPSSLTKIGVRDRLDIYIEQLLYENKLTNTDLIEKLDELINDRSIIVADCSEPDRIEEIRRAGYVVQECRKGPNSVKDGIDVVKRKRLHIVKTGTETIKEIKFYKWKEDKAGNVLDEPVKFKDHSMDGIRYGIDKLNTPESNLKELADEQHKHSIPGLSTRAQRERAAAIRANR